MKTIFQYIKKIHENSNIILKKNIVFYCFFKFYNSKYKTKISNFFITLFLFILLLLSIIISISLDKIISNINIEFLKLIISFISFAFILFVFGCFFIKFSKFISFIRNKISNFIIKTIENYILKHFSGVDKNIIINIDYFLFFVERPISEIEDSFNKNLLHLDKNLSNISYDLILKFEKEEKINNF